MRLHSTRAFRYGVILLLAVGEAFTASVPFVGCKSDGQVGPQDAPTGTTIEVPISAKAAAALAYYKAEQTLGVLAPRGWHCFGTYGSGGETLFVSPERVDTIDPLSIRNVGFRGPVVELSRRYGGTSGREFVAEVISRVFPAYTTFAKSVAHGPPAIKFPSGPYPDQVIYRAKSIVEFETPAQTRGLGTRFTVKPNGSPIDGVAIVIGDVEEPDVLLVSVRLPAKLQSLAPAIIQQVELEAAPYQLK